MINMDIHMTNISIHMINMDIHMINMDIIIILYLAPPSGSVSLASSSARESG